MTAMKTTKEILEALRTCTATRSVYGVAKMLGMNDAHVRSWYIGKSLPDALSCVRIAQVLDIEPLAVIAVVEAEREKDEVKRARWRELSRKLSGSALAAIYTAIGLTAAYSPASQVAPYSPNEERRTLYYVHLRLRRLTLWLCPHGFGRFPAFGSYRPVVGRPRI